MRTKITFLSLLLFIVFNNYHSLAQINQMWQRPCDNGSPQNMPRRITSDKDGSVYVAADDWYNQRGWINLYKYGVNGDLLWIKPIPVDVSLPVSRGVVELDIDSLGNPLIISYTLPAVGTNYTEIIKCDSAGIKLWNIIIPDSINLTSTIITMSVDKHGNLYFEGLDYLNHEINLWKYDSSGTFIFKINRSLMSGALGTQPLFDFNNNSYFKYVNFTSGTPYSYIFKVDPVGNVLDSLILFCNFNYLNFTSCIDANDNLILARDTIISGQNKSYLEKYDNNFNLVWSSGPYEQIKHLIVDHNENIYAVHNFDGNQQYPYNRIIIYKFDSAGNQLWSHPFNLLGNIPQYSVTGMIFDAYDYPIIAGLKYDNGYLGGGLYSNKFFIEKLNYNGMMLSYEEKITPTITGYIQLSMRNFSDDINILSVDSLNKVFKYCSDCATKLSGTVYFDADSNCVQGALEQGIKNAIVEIIPGEIYTNTDSSGFYHLYLPDSTYSAFCKPYGNYNNTCPVAAVPFVISNSTAVSNVDFGLHVPNNIHDLLVNVAHGPIRRGFDLLFVINYQNIGAYTASGGTVDFVYDSIFSFIQSSVSPSIIIADTLRWNFSNLLPGESRSITVILNLSPSTPLGTSYENFTFIHGLLYEDNPDDNADVDAGTVIGSYDPNDKNVTPKGIGSQGYITANDSVLLYKINFENTGTDTAFAVMIIDTISPQLDMTSIRSGASSHNYILQVEKSNILKFIFNNILLPDSATNSNANYGFINFYIKQKPLLTVGTVIKNSADIYFDSNLPIKTNTTLNTITLINEVSANDFSFEQNQIYPNPVKDVLYLSSTTPLSANLIITVSDIQGRVVEEKKILNTKGSAIAIDVSKLSQGVYLLRMAGVMKRFVKL